MSAICLTAGTFAASLLVQSFTLSWTHSIEKVEWQEDWRPENGRLVLTASRVKGSGAGMEVPDGAVLAGGWYHYWPKLPPLPELLLARSGFAGDYTLCYDGGCLPLERLIPAAAGTPARLRVCG